MGLSRVVLTPFVGAYNVRGISQALSDSIPDEGPRRSVVTTGTVMDVFQ
jgi:hypothetical protein